MIAKAIIFLWIMLWLKSAVGNASPGEIAESNWFSNRKD